MTYRMNTDYEHALFDPNYFIESPKFQKMTEEYEFLYHLLNSSPLLTRKYISPEYTEYLEKLTDHKIKRTKEDSLVENWIGSLSDITLEKKINSKIFTYENVENSHFYKICHSIEEVQKCRDYPVIVKSPFFYSGMGFKKLNSIEDFDSSTKWLNKQLDLGPLIVEELLDRVLDIGVYVKDNQTYIYKNFIDKKFQYKGTLFPYGHSFIDNFEIENKTDDIKELILKAGGRLSFNFDSFFYEKDNKIALNHCHDLNYRKSLGSHVVEIQKKYFPLKTVKYSFFNQKKLKYFSSFSKMIETLSQIDNFIILSPLGNIFMAYLVVGENEEEIDYTESRALGFLV